MGYFGYQAQRARKRPPQVIEKTVAREVVKTNIVAQTHVVTNVAVQTPVQTNVAGQTPVAANVVDWQSGPDGRWFVKWDDALADARAKKRPMLVLNTGSTWCS